MDIVEVVARAICRVQLNGGDPDQPAVRWNGTEMEPQSFPAWRDYMDEAMHSLSAIEAAGMAVVPKEPTREMLLAARDWSVAKYGMGVGNDGASGCYRAMLAATPQE